MREEHFIEYRVLVQHAAYLDKNKALELKKALEKEGMIIYLHTKIIKKQTYHKVLQQVGSYREENINKQGSSPALEKANQQAKTLRKAGKYASVEKAVLSRKAPELKDKIIVLDPGHGGSDPGAIGPKGTMEKVRNLQVALLTKQLLLQEGATVKLTRETDTLISLYNRPEVANAAKANLFVSIHMNGFTNPAARGTEIIYGNSPGSYDLALLMQKSFRNSMGLFDRGVKLDSRGLAVLRKAKVPACLVEMAFITNEVEENMFSTAATWNKAAQAIFRGCLDFCNN